MQLAPRTKDTGFSYGLASRMAPRFFGPRRHKMTRAGLAKLAVAESDALIRFLERREAGRPPNDTVIEDHEYPHRRVTLYDEETQRLYAECHLPRVADLRQQFAERGIRSQPLDAFYQSPANGADLRTVSTALFEMTRRLR